MCRAATCKTCGKTTWAGCGRHVPDVMRHVPSASVAPATKRRPPPGSSHACSGDDRDGCIGVETGATIEGGASDPARIARTVVAIEALLLVDMVSGINLGWFILFGVIGSLGDVPGMTAREALLPAIVRPGGVSAERLMGVRESLGAVALLLGSAAAGTLMVLFDGSTVLWITAATSLLAALITMLIPRHVGAITADDGAAVGRSVGTGWSQLRDGWKILFQSHFLITVTMVSLISVLVLAAIQGLILPVYLAQVEQPGLLGFVLTALALGMLVGGGVWDAGPAASVVRRRPRRHDARHCSDRSSRLHLDGVRGSVRRRAG